MKKQLSICLAAALLAGLLLGCAPADPPAASAEAPTAAPAQTAAPTAEAICRGFALCAGSAAGRDSLTAPSTGAMPVCTSGRAA